MLLGAAGDAELLRRIQVVLDPHGRFRPLAPAFAPEAAGGGLVLHSIDSKKLGAAGSDMAKAIEGCVHCGFCLPVCPTYQELGEEMDSPRGRILLMKEVLEDHLAAADARPFVDRCLGCLACEPACPSGVSYRDLLHGYRDHTEKESPRPLLDRLRRSLVHRILPSPSLFRWALRGGRIAAPLSFLAPASWRPLLNMAAEIPWPLARATPLPTSRPANGKRRARVALLSGCAQEVLAPQITRAAVRVLGACGVEVVVPRGQGCCGSLALHDGEASRALDLAQHNVAVFPRDVDAILTTAAGCGSGIAGYPALFRHAGVDPREADELASKTRDLSAFLVELGLPPVPALPTPLTVAYQGACHLEHAQGIRSEPRALLERVPGLTLVPMAGADRCCGSAGTYNLEQPEMAEQLGRAKAEAVISAGVDAVATGNVGCLVQMRLHLKRLGSAVSVLHTVELLDQAYRG